MPLRPVQRRDACVLDQRRPEARMLLADASQRVIGPPHPSRVPVPSTEGEGALVVAGALGVIRTPDTRFRKPMLYPLSYEGKGSTLPAKHLLSGGANDEKSERRRGLVRRLGLRPNAVPTTGGPDVEAPAAG